MMIPEADHPRAVGQLANLHDFDGTGDVQLPEDVGRKATELKGFDSYH